MRHALHLMRKGKTYCGLKLRREGRRLEKKKERGENEKERKRVGQGLFGSCLKT